MGRRRIFWHIGPDDLGTAFIARALDVRREELADADVLVPGSTASWELVTTELRRSHQQLGYRRGEVEGQSATLARRIWKHRGTTVLSTPGLASASPDQVLLALDGFRGAEIHLVFVVRDLTSQVYAGVQAMLEQGGTSRPVKFIRRVLDPEEGHRQAFAFRAGNDLPTILSRWTRTVLPEHVHVIAATGPDEIWQELMALIGATVPLPAEAVQPQLGPAGLEVLRKVALALDERLGARGRRTALRDWLSRGLLPAEGDRLPVLDRGSTAQEWTDQVRRRGFAMHGTITSGPAEGLEVPSAGAPEEIAAAALAEALLEVARLQQENADLAAENLRLHRKRSKHKLRADELGRRVA